MNKFKPKSPDPYIRRSEDMELAKFGHLNAIVDVLNQQAQNNLGLTALAAGTQVGATPVIPGFNTVTVGSPNSSLILPSLAALCACTPCGPIAPVTIVNLTANDIVIYPAVGESIDGLAIDTPVTINPGESLTFKDVSCSAWQTFNASGTVSLPVSTIQQINDCAGAPLVPVAGVVTLPDVVVDGTTITGTGCTGDPLVANIPITSIEDCAGTPLVPVAGVITLPDVVVDGTTITGTGCTGDPLVANVPVTSIEDCSGNTLVPVAGVVSLPGVTVAPVSPTEALTGDGCLVPLSVCIDDITITKDLNGCLQAVIPPPASVEFAAFFGMTAGGGNTGVDDYAATFANAAAGEVASVAAGSGINFPRLQAPVVGGIVINDPGAAQTNNTEFLLPAIGVYQISFMGSVDEPTKVDLFVGSAPSQAPGGTFAPYTTALGTPFRTGRATGTDQIATTGLFYNSIANQVIQMRFAGTVGGANTITPLPGGTVRAQAMTLTIVRIA